MRALALIFALLLPAAAAAQTATLVSDRLYITGDDRLIAEGRVEVMEGTTRLTASRLVYDRSADRLTLEGPLTLVEGDGDAVVLASQGALDADLEDGILVSARLVLDRQLQLAANQINRVSGRYTLLTKAVASSCQVCAANPVPTWEIRASRIVHDDLEQQLYFDNATFRLLGVPVFYIPRLRLPDPTLDRARGVLVPTVRSSSRLGFGVRVPYFLPLGSHADLTLAPYVSENTTTLELGYRQELRRGRIAFEGAVSRDDLTDDATRYYLFGEAAFLLPRSFRLDLAVQEVSDTGYLTDYDYSNEDRLETSARLTRVDRLSLFDARLSGFETLRDSERPIAGELPRLYGTARLEQRLRLGGGTLSFGADAAVLDRRSDADGAGRDLAMAGLSLGWRGDRMLPGGIVGAATLGLDGRAYTIDNDSTFDDEVSRITPEAAVELRWPFTRTGPGGTFHLIEPVAHLAWSDPRGGPVPNEDSTLVELDEGNLFSLSRFPGEDAVEDGLRLSLGASYLAETPGGLSLGVTAGRVIRAEDSDLYPMGTGLDGRLSDWLVAGHARLSDGLSMIDRAVFDDDLSMSKNELRLDLDRGRTDLAASYIWLDGVPEENRPDATHELAFDAGYRLTRTWTGSIEGRFDVASERAQRAGVGLQYRNECITLDLSASRRYTSSTSVTPATSFGVQVSLAGFGSGGGTSADRAVCRN
ncbi:LPS-assembly protein LptD [Mesobaculum littorinae]|uniref:LPS-assembly protein LptD n=1 Tax=Mesobaculum littorinae TaxID=2486419 RepID=A0A438AJW3_9RHOB|nr:LPS assembly protein LptD [Mesobaculum littorinae]RVV98934.1 LPS-assembly protein LptD [Mesobaculum littorinae]